MEAAQQTPVRQQEGKFAKDKSSEKDPALDPWKATHITEAADTLIQATQRHKLGEAEQFTDTAYQ
jgi:hypothetical protein